MIISFRRYYIDILSQLLYNFPQTVATISRHMFENEISREGNKIFEKPRQRLTDRHFVSDTREMKEELRRAVKAKGDERFNLVVNL